MSHDVIPRRTATALLRAAEDEISAIGSPYVSLRAIARRADVSHQTPGFIYGDRKGLLTALAADGFASLAVLTNELLGELGADAEADDRLQTLAIAYVTFAQRRPGVFDLMSRPELVHADDPALQAAKVESFGLLVAALEQAQALGWAAGYPLDSLTMLCWAVVHGIVTLARDGALGVMFAEVSAVDAARSVTDVLSGALRPDPLQA